MTTRCAQPVEFGHLVDYWAGDLDSAENDRVEAHLFGCEVCSAEAARVAGIAEAFRNGIPPIVGADQLLALRARGLVIEDNPVEPGIRREVAFPPGVDILLHHLQGLDLAGAERVHVSVRAESTGDLIFEDPFAPFDRERGEVLVACQRHFVLNTP
jgi:hypothetical protein